MHACSTCGKVLTPKFLLSELWDLTDVQYHKVYVRQLRQKVETDPERPQYILTETGIGYRLRAAQWATCAHVGLEYCGFSNDRKCR
jgi:DNA-binding response OmpR family regulator